VSDFVDRAAGIFSRVLQEGVVFVGLVSYRLFRNRLL